MKKFFIFSVLAILSTMGLAQSNMKYGYIITNQGDSIYGDIDFQTNEKLSKQCVFRADGAEEITTYKPGDIEGFRFRNGGKYFVSRKLNVTDTPELYFAEFIVDGVMNLYCVVYNGDEFFFFEREDGEMALLTKRNVNLTTNYNRIMDAKKENLAEAKQQYAEVATLMKDSWTAVTEMNESELSRRTLVKVMRDYHNDVCTDGSSCVVYEYKEKADDAKAHFKVFGGYIYYSDMMTKDQTSKASDETYPGSSCEFGVGYEIDLDRINKGLGVECGLALSPRYSSDHTYHYDRAEYYTKYEMTICTLSAGVVKRFGNWKVQPLVRGGVFLVNAFNSKEYSQRDNGIQKDLMQETKWRTVNHYGAYAGVGVQMPVGNHAIRLHGDIYKALEIKSFGKMMRYGVTAEYIF